MTVLRVTDQQKSEMLSLIYDARIDREAMRTLLEAGDLLEFLRKYSGMGLQPDIYHLPPRKRRDLHSLIFQGKFDYVDTRIHTLPKDDNNLPEGPPEVRLYRHPEELTTEEMIRRTKERRLVHQKLAELLLLHEAVPDLLRTMDIAALGSLTNSGGIYYVPMLHYCLGESQLIMRDIGSVGKLPAGLPTLVAGS